LHVLRLLGFEQRRFRAVAGRGRSIRTVALAAATLALGLAAGGPAEAASRFCRQLQARLAEPSASPQLRHYERAAQEQLDQLIEVERHAGERGCFNYYGNGDPLCPGLLRTLERMDRNLAEIERRIDELARRGDSRRERARIMAALEANQCEDDEQEVRILPPPIDQAAELDNGNVISGPFQAGTFRTLCVRTCDGYYFPISYSVTPDLFDRDEQKCRAMCPGTEVQLFSHRVPGEESKDMVSGAGTPYTSLANAFKYREAGYVRAEGCGCSPAKNFSVVAGEPPEEPETGSFVIVVPPEPEQQALVPIPTPRPDPPVPVEEASVQTSAPEAKKPVAAEPARPAGERKVRVVGPVFLPDPEGAIDLRSPGRSSVQ
jgi:hypothetical protein